jgi:tripartite-type tricarboxylate transporter receptor subunit TctC
MTFISRMALRLAAAAAVVCAIALSASPSALALDYPTKPVRLIVGVAPGGANDTVARLVAQALSERLGQPVVVENRPGAGGNIGLEAVVNAAPDGYTLLFATSANALAASFYDNANVNFARDIAPVTSLVRGPLVMEVNPSFPARTIPEFIAYAKANPGRLNFGFGQGTLPHLVGEAFKIATGTEIASIPYRGGAQAITDMLGGRIHMNLGAGTTLVPLIREGRIKALAVTSPRRSNELPDVPTMAESGLPDLTTVTYYGFLGPAGTPAEVVARINQEVNDSLKSTELRTSMARVGFEPVGGSPEAFASLISEQLKRFAPLATSTGFTME